MLSEVGFVLAMVAAVLVVRRVSAAVGVPAAVSLTVVGLVYGLAPGPNLPLEPQLVLYVVLPPLLYHAALESSLLAIRSRLRSIVSLSVLLVLVSAVAVGFVLDRLISVVPLAAAVAVGAAVAPPDPVAALSVGRRAGLPAKLSTLIEGEGLLNDATALTIYQVAVAAAVGGGFSFPAALGRFAAAAAGGVVVGAAVAWLVHLARQVFADPLSVNTVSLLTPFCAYAAGSAVHVSGVLAVVVAGLVVGHQNPRLQTGASRLQTSAVWQLVNFLLEGFVFLLIGQQLPAVLHGLGSYPVGTVVLTAGATVGVVLVVRPLWLVLTQHVPRRLHARLGSSKEEHARGRDEALSAREITALSWAGTRGVITLAAAFAIPAHIGAGHPFPGRDLLLLAAYVVVLVTLLGQGLTFAPLLRRLGIRADLADEVRLRSQAREAAVVAALARLEQLTEEEDLPQDVIVELRRHLTWRQQRARAQAQTVVGEDPGALASVTYQAAARVRRALIQAEHEELLRWRDAGRLPDASLRILQRELDHEERAIPMPPHR